MVLSSPNTWIAPLSTGHPAGLPKAPKKPMPHTRVTAPGSGDAMAGFMQGQDPSNFWRAASGQPDPAMHIAPPSIMQMKITQMLDDQAQDQAGTADPQASEPTPEAEQIAEAPKTLDVPESDQAERVPKANTASAPQAPYDPAEAIARSSVFSTLP